MQCTLNLPLSIRLGVKRETGAYSKLPSRSRTQGEIGKARIIVLLLPIHLPG